MRELKLKDGSKIYKPDKIWEEMWDFYTNLYSKHETINIEESSFRGIEEKLPKLNENEKNNLEAYITIDELKM